LITGMLFFLAGSVKHRYHTLHIGSLKGMLITIPRLAWILGLCAMASLGLPGLAGFWGEFPAILSAYSPGFGLSQPLFRTLMGEEQPDSGTVKIGETVQISYVDQGRGGIDPKKTLWEVVSDGLDFIKVANFEMNSRAYVASFGFKGPDQQKKAGVLSGGERNRLHLAKTLMSGGNVLLLDEPSLGLAPKIVDVVFEALAQIRDSGLGVLLVEQRAQRTVALADRSHVLANGELRLTLGPDDAGDTDRLVAAYLA